MTDFRLATGRTAGHAPEVPDSPRKLPKSTTDTGGSVIDAAVIEQLASITDSQGFSVLSELLHAFLAAVPTRLNALDQAMATGDLDVLANQAHALTGSSASFGAVGMATLCRRLRAAAEQNEVERSRALVTLLHAEYVQVRASLVSLIRGAA